MKKLIVYILAILSISPYTFASEQIITKTYGDSIEYVDYLKLQLQIDQLTPGHLEIIPKLENKLNARTLNLPEEREENFEKFMTDQISNRSLSLETLRIKSASEIIILAVKIVTDSIDYELVDLDGVKNYDETLENGKGDCDKYKNSLIKVFSWFKKYCPSIKHIVISESLGGEDLKHAWNSILVFTPTKLFTSQIDPTFYDNKHDLNDLEADRGYHFSDDRNIFWAKFFGGVGEFERGFEILNRIDLKSAERKKVADIYSTMIELAYDQQSSASIMTVIKKFEVYRFVERDKMLFQIIATVDDEKFKQSKFKMLENIYPESEYTTQAKEYLEDRKNRISAFDRQYQKLQTAQSKEIDYVNMFAAMAQAQTLNSPSRMSILEKRAKEMHIDIESDETLIYLVGTTKDEESQRDYYRNLLYKKFPNSQYLSKF